MPGFNMSIAHSQTEDEALKRIKNELAELKTRFADKISELQEDWNGNTCEFSLSIKGFSGSGTMIVKPTEIEISGDLPFPAILFKSKIKFEIREKLKQLLA
jgi:hypothetical protein